MIALLIAVGGLFMAVIGSAIIDPSGRSRPPALAADNARPADFARPTCTASVPTLHNGD
jgi:hypothetical protein